MITKRKIILIVALFLAFLTAFRFMWLHFYASPHHPFAAEGVLDVRDWDAFNDHSLSLDGEWEFYPNVLLMQNKEDHSSLQAKKGLIEVPGKWNHSLQPDTPQVFGHGSYRLRILVDPEKGNSFGFRVPRILTSSEIYINGELQSQTGRPAEDKDRYAPLDKPTTVYFTLENGSEIELVIHVANFDNTRSGGIVNSIDFGLVGPLNQYVSFANNLVSLAVVAYIIHAVYGFILFFVVKRDTRIFHFSMMIICVILATLTDGERLLYEWIPFNYEWSVKIVHLTVVGGGYYLFQCIRHLLPTFIRTKVFFVYAIISGISAFSILMLPLSYSVQLYPIYLMMMAIPCFLAPIVMFRSTSKIDKNNIFLLLAIIASMNSLVWLFIIERQHVDVFSYPFDLILAMILFASYWFKQYFIILEESQKLTAKLQKSDRDKDDFLATVAHELRNPLHGILNLTQSVLERDKNVLGAKSAKDLDMLITVGRRMSYLLNDLLDSARLKTNRIVLQPQRISIHIVTASVIDMLRYMTEGKPIQFVNQIPRNFPLVLADENRIIQILFNLLHNAVKYSHSGEIAIRASIHSNWVSISVIDSGIGMNDEVLERVFQPYEQADQPFTSVERGLGLGLSICKQLVEMHGGTLVASSKPHHGSAFTFTLPLSPSSLPEVEEDHLLKEATSLEEVSATSSSNDAHTAIKSTASSDGTCILAVDDDPVNLKVLVSIFATETYEIFTATSGTEALSLLDTREWDLIITDVMMPHMSGYELTSRIRERYSISELPILLLTASNRDEDIEAGFRLGANDYVTKPMNATELKARVSSLTNLKQSVNERLRLEAAWLQAQIKPHFLLNTFNSIAALSKMDIERMDDLMEELSNYMRLSIDFQNFAKVAPLENELTLVRAYLYIQKERFDERLEVVWEVDDHIQLDIPPLSIQPLVENAVIHGILKRVEGGQIRIRITDRGQDVEVCITDNGVGIDEEQLKHILDKQPGERSGIGLLNTDRRLKQHYGTGLTIESKLGTGTTVSFLITKKNLGAHH